MFQGKLDEYTSNGNLSYGEQIDILSASSALGHEYMNIMKGWMSDINQGNREEAKMKAEQAAAYRDFMLNVGFPVEGVETILSKDTMRYIQQGNILKQTGGKTGEAMGRTMWKERGFEELPPEAPEAPKITDYKGAADYLSKFAQTASPETFEKIRAGLQKQFPDIDLSAITQRSLKEPVTPVTEPTPAPTSTENIRRAISDADTVKDAQRIYKNYADKYDEKALGIDDLDRFWAESQIPYLDNIKTAIGNIIDERGWLKKGTLTEKEVGVEFEGEQPVEEIYERLREDYMKYRAMLEKLGIDISQFPELKPLKEIEKVGLGEGFWGWGIQKGQYKSIYR
ncbi:hypothetical protein ES695_18175 [Candidatus Atribacteria bacterium 1244-E10-H5-B2]|nr:MAG: hypothetical protein ES695_18175 [Candidatus Atribacteria bacterium 1244-E10-H5-B2]